MACPTGLRRFLSREAALAARGAMARRDEHAATLQAMWCSQCCGCHLTSEPKRLLDAKPAAHDREAKQAKVREAIARHLATTGAPSAKEK